MKSSLERGLLELVADVQGLLHLAELREGMLGALQRAVPSDWASLNDIGSDPSDTVVINRPPLARRWHERFGPLAHQNPLLGRWLATRDGRAYRFSDVASRTELEALPLFREVYLPLGVNYQIAFTLPSPSDRVLAVALSRRDEDFDDLEREFLNRARPFLIQAYRNALTVERLTAGGPDPARAGLVSLLAGEGLSPRQAQITVEVAHGRSSASIAASLGISERTCQKHIQLAFRTLGVTTRSQASERVWALAGSARR